MWIYQKTLEYPIKITKPDPRMALLITTQYGGPDGEIGAALRYLSQRFAMPTNESKGVLNDIGTEEANLPPLGEPPASSAPVSVPSPILPDP